MRFKFILSHSVLGSIEIAEPISWKDAELKLERHEDFHSLVEHFEGDFTFYGNDGIHNGGIDFIRQVEQTYGPDAELIITIKIAPDDFTYQNVFIGQLDVWGLEEMPDNKMQNPIIRNDFWAKFINRYDTPVDLQSALSLDDTPVTQFDNISTKLTSQKIPKTTRYEGRVVPSADDPLTQYNLPTGGAIDANGASDDFTLYTQAGLDLTQDEINDSFTLPFAFVDDIVEVFNVLEFLDEGGDITISASAQPQLHIHGGLLESSGESDPSSIDEITVFTTLFVKKNDEAAISIATAGESKPGPPNPTIGGGPISFDFFYDFNLAGNVSLTVSPTDILTVYIRYELFFNIDIGSDTGSIEWIGPRYIEFTSYESDVSFLLQSIFQDNNAQGFLLHDAGGQILDRITSTDQAFYSALMGSDQTVYRQYEEDGCRWQNALLKGLQIRRYSLPEKPFFMSFKQWWEGANPMFNLGLGYELFNGEEIIRVEEKRHFYDASQVSVNIGNVRDIVRKYDDNRIFKVVKIGHKKWQSEDISGIDDAQTKHTYASINKKSGKDITLESEFIAASLAIETTRRKTREKSADYKYDNDIFIVALNPVPIEVSPPTSPDVADFLPELDENFDSITNLLNADTRYNSRFTPARNMLNWIDWLSAGQQAYPDTFFKFTAGEGNYDMTSQLNDVYDCGEYESPLSEKQDIPVSTNPFHLALMYEITCPLDWEDYVLIRDNRKLAIGISQTNDNFVKFFIKELNYKVTKGLVTILAWPVELLSIDVIETTTRMEICAPVLPCEDAYLTEDGFEFITEAEDCLVLN